MTRVVLLQVPFGKLRELEVLAGASNIESATGLKPSQIARLDDNDKTAIFEVMRDE